MLPFLHLGPLTLPTFGLLVVMGMAVGCFVLRADLRRRGLVAEPVIIIGLTGLAGIVGARLYPLLFSRTGREWFGGLMAGLATLVWLAWCYRIPMLVLMDAMAPATALGYGVGRIGCLTSGDGDYGVPTSLPWGMSFPHGIVPTTERVHPTPIYEFLGAVVIFYVLWRLGTRRQPAGAVAAIYLLLTGAARFLVEFVRINPRSFVGLTNAQVMSLVSIAAGLILLRAVRFRSDTATTNQHG